MKKRWAIAAGLLALCAGGFLLVRQALPQSKLHTQNSTVVLGESSLPNVTLHIQDSSGPDRVLGGIRASSPFDALREIPTEAGVSVETKQYDFGLFVTAIAGRVAGSDEAWIWEVNGTPGTVASDKYALKEGDVVTWRLSKMTK